jgi:hypothetical protein
LHAAAPGLPRRCGRCWGGGDALGGGALAATVDRRGDAHAAGRAAGG